MTHEQCNHFDKCSVQLCPMDTDELNKNYTWYPDEEICRKRKDIPNWVKKQRSIVKKVTPENLRFYYNLDMLKVPFRVTASVKGLDPDEFLVEEPKQLKAWFRKYKGTKSRKLTKKQKEGKQKSIAKARSAKAKKVA